jgi:hypothetical protein
LRKRAIFAHAIFSQPPDFWAVTLIENLDLTGARFGFSGTLHLRKSWPIPTPGWTTDTQITDDLRRLRGVAKQIHATDAERDLFILERQAERGSLWKKCWTGGWKSRLLDWRTPVAVTVWIFFYSLLSDCGRSMLRPLFWLVAANVGAFFSYGWLADMPIPESLWNLTLANLLPFGTLAKPLAEHAAAELFHGGVMPPGVGLTAIFQGVVNALLVFLLALALRNHFKVK